MERISRTRREGDSFFQDFQLFHLIYDLSWMITQLIRSLISFSISPLLRMAPAPQRKKLYECGHGGVIRPRQNPIALTIITEMEVEVAVSPTDDLAACTDS